MSEEHKLPEEVEEANVKLREAYTSILEANPENQENIDAYMGHVQEQLGTVVDEEGYEAALKALDDPEKMGYDISQLEGGEELQEAAREYYRAIHDNREELEAFLAAQEETQESRGGGPGDGEGGRGKGDSGPGWNSGYKQPHTEALKGLGESLNQVGGQVQELGTEYMPQVNQLIGGLQKQLDEARKQAEWLKNDATNFIAGSTNQITKAGDFAGKLAEGLKGLRIINLEKGEEFLKQKGAEIGDFAKFLQS